MKDHKLFEYVLTDACLRPLSSITILDAEERLVVYGTYRGRYERRIPDYAELKSVIISEAAMENIKSILCEPHIYEIKGVEDVTCLDGYVQRFYISDGKHITELFTDNIDLCDGNPEEYPNACELIGILRRIAAVLIGEGVEKECFLLARE